MRVETHQLRSHNPYVIAKIIVDRLEGASRRKANLVEFTHQDGPFRLVFENVSGKWKLNGWAKGNGPTNTLWPPKAHWAYLLWDSLTTDPTETRMPA